MASTGNYFRTTVNFKNQTLSGRCSGQEASYMLYREQPDTIYLGTYNSIPDGIFRFWFVVASKYYLNGSYIAWHSF